MILVVDDDIVIRTSLSLVLKRAGYSVEAVAYPAEAISIVRNTAPQLILLDMNYSLSTDGVEGLTLLKQIRLFQPLVPVILMTAWGNIQLAVDGIKAGAQDFITKPWDNISLLQRVKTAIELTEGSMPIASDDFNRCGIIGESPQLLSVLDTVKRIARTDASVLITGESGTGKELVAEAIHRNSNRQSKAFVKVNLGGISQSLFESEMFGHRKGSFTGAVADRQGRFEIVRYVRDQLFLHTVGLGQLVARKVQRIGKLYHLFPVIDAVEVHIKMPFRQTVRLFRHLRHRLRQPACHRTAHEKAEHKHEHRQQNDTRGHTP